jgi:hypothetical protein
MPMQLAVHAKWCKRISGGECNCTPLSFTDIAKAQAAHEGDATRMEVLAVTPPATNFARWHVPDHRSQARRHRHPISD